MRDAFRARSSGGFSGGRSGLLLWISLATMLGAALIAICPSAKANVTPEVVLRVHVQDTPDSSFCQTNPITACNQIRRATYASGEVEFDMYVHPILLQDHLPLHGVSAALVWPAAWQVQEFEPCSGGVGSLQVGTAGGQLELLFPGDPPLPDDRPLRWRDEATPPHGPPAGAGLDHRRTVVTWWSRQRLGWRQRASG